MNNGSYEYIYKGVIFKVLNCLGEGKGYIIMILYFWLWYKSTRYGVKA